MYYGDYYHGDYYRGDPFLGGLLSAGARLVAKKVLPAIGRAVGIGGGPKTAVGRIAQGVTTTVGVGTIVGAGVRGGKQLFEGERRRGRRMNVLNPKALRRAIRRGRGFAKFARTVMTFPFQKPPRGRALFKRKR